MKSFFKFIFVKKLLKIITQNIELNNTSVLLHIRREDLIHPFVSGNKYRKLKYNLIQAEKEAYKTLLTFGGAFSNHIAATAYAGKENNFNTIGIIRGEELIDKIDENPTLKFAKDCGMKFVFVTRHQYGLKETKLYIDELQEKFGSFYLIPEGGNNDLGIKGCEEILSKDDSYYDYVVCPVGTSGTILGIINSISSHQKVLGIPCLKGDFLKEDISKFAKNNNWDLISDYHFEGYAKVTNSLITFINTFYEQYSIPLDPIYTGKMVFGVIDLINKNYFQENAKILLIHTGGIQGIQGMNKKLKRKNLQTIIYND